MADNRVISEYDRYLSPLDVWAIAFGCTIGWGAFMMPGSTFLPVAGPLGSHHRTCHLWHTAVSNQRLRS